MKRHFSKMQINLLLHSARKWKITAQEVVYTISYRQWNGIYYMNHIRGDLYFKVKLKRQWFSASSLHTWFEMVTCKVDVDNVKKIPLFTISSPNSVPG